MQLKLDNTHVSHLTAFEPHGNSLMRCWRLDPLCWRSIAQRLWFERKRTLPTGSMWLFHSVSCCSFFCCGVYICSMAVSGQCVMALCRKIPMHFGLSAMGSVKRSVVPTTNHRRLGLATLLAWTARSSVESQGRVPSTSWLPVPRWNVDVWIIMNPYIRVESENMKGFQILHGMIQKW
jgi:hypothetical protein